MVSNIFRGFFRSRMELILPSLTLFWFQISESKSFWDRQRKPIVKLVFGKLIHHKLQHKQGRVRMIVVLHCVFVCLFFALVGRRALE